MRTQLLLWKQWPPRSPNRQLIEVFYLARGDQLISKSDHHYDSSGVLPASDNKIPPL